MTETRAPGVTLTDFLLARIAEDESVARTAGVMRPDLLPDTRVPYPDPGLVEVRMSPVRVLAKCEAKRRIADDATNQHTSSPDYDQVVRYLAAIHADHSDYRDEWRP